MKEVLIETQNIPASQRHAAILKVFDNLAAGESVTIVNNGDPKPLIVQVEQKRPLQFDSDYLEKGPKAWLVKLTKKISTGRCG